MDLQDILVKKIREAVQDAAEGLIESGDVLMAMRAMRLGDEEPAFSEASPRGGPALVIETRPVKRRALPAPKEAKKKKKGTWGRHPREFSEEELAKARALVARGAGLGEFRAALGAPYATGRKLFVKFGGQFKNGGMKPKESQPAQGRGLPEGGPRAAVPHVPAEHRKIILDILRDEELTVHRSKLQMKCAKHGLRGTAFGEALTALGREGAVEFDAETLEVSLA